MRSLPSHPHISQSRKSNRLTFPLHDLYLISELPSQQAPPNDLKVLQDNVLSLQTSCRRVPLPSCRDHPSLADHSRPTGKSPHRSNSLLACSSCSMVPMAATTARISALSTPSSAMPAPVSLTTHVDPINTSSR